MTISWPAAASASSRHELTGLPSTSTAHAPQAPSPQASFVPSSSRSSRRTASSRRPAGLHDVALSVDLEHDRHTPRTTGACPCTSSGVGSAGAQSAPHSRARPGAARGRLRWLVERRRREHRRDDRGDDRRGDTTAGADGCTDVDVPAAREDGGATAPKERLDPEKTYDLVFKTNCGSFTVTLDLEKAPATAASLVSLAKSGFYDDTIFHRIVPGFVIQGGDPTQSGSGGPGYQTVDPPPADATYVKGVVAMAKTGAEPAGTSGSQFFVVTGPDAAACRPTTRSSARSRAGWTPSSGSTGSATSRPVRHADAPRRDRVGDGRGTVSIAAVVLAAGEASRFGTPKQRLLLPEVLERLAQSAGRRDRRRGRCAHTRDAGPGRDVRRLEARPRARRSRAGSRSSATTSRRRSSSSPTGPISRPRPSSA